MPSSKGSNFQNAHYLDERKQRQRAVTLAYARQGIADSIGPYPAEAIPKPSYRQVVDAQSRTHLASGSTNSRPSQPGLWPVLGERDELTQASDIESAIIEPAISKRAKTLASFTPSYQNQPQPGLRNSISSPLRRSSIPTESRSDNPGLDIAAWAKRVGSYSPTQASTSGQTFSTIRYRPLKEGENLDLDLVEYISEAPRPLSPTLLSPPVNMNNLQVWGGDLSVTKQKAIEDAKKMQAVVNEECAKMDQESPPYLLSELIGKGSFGRVYKATSLKSNDLVAVKIIDIEESDTLNPKLADTYREILNEINALKLLSDSGAKNINHVIDAMPVGQSMWMITEYCAGGSVATLMKPTAPGGLQEKWIIPILRECAEAIFWVHRQGIIHRDIKCANVFVTEAGGVQLGDFGVAGVIETKFDKRSTFIGTPHWMAPELFDQSAQYGTEVDIWAFGSLVFEIASGLPPNVASYIDVMKLGDYLKTHTPRLKGDQYSEGLKDLVAYCLVDDPARRPTIEQVQHHSYIFNTNADYPTTSLALLVRGYKQWEAQGGSRKSLFAAGGAQGPTELSSTALASDEWNFSSTAAFDQLVMNNRDSQAVYDAYGSNIDFMPDAMDDATSRSKPKGRRRPPPQALAAMKVPLEKVFDPNTISNYHDNSRAYYGQPMPPPSATTSDLPLRDDSRGADTVRESLIDLDASLHGSDLSSFVDLATIRAGGNARASTDYDMFGRPPLSDPADHDNRRTRDWKFPTMPPASANPEMSHFSFNDDSNSVTPVGVARPPLLHHPTEPITGQNSFGGELMVPRTNQAANRVSAGSLIDLDMSMPDPVPELTRPSTANSDAASVSGSDVGFANPFDLERHASLYIPATNREPSIYVSDDSEFAQRLAKDEDPVPASNDAARMLPPRGDSFGRGIGGNGYATDSTQSYPGTDYSDNEFTASAQNTLRDADYLISRAANGNLRSSVDSSSSVATTATRLRTGQAGSGGLGMSMGPGGVMSPPPPAPPSERVMQGLAEPDEIKAELKRLLNSFSDHLHLMGDDLSGIPVRRASTRQDSNGDMN